MNKLNLVEILKFYKGETFYTSMFGKVKLVEILSEDRPIKIQMADGLYVCLTSEGKYSDDKDAECVLFPSKDQRNWNEWIEKEKNKGPKTWNGICRDNKVTPMHIVVAKKCINGINSDDSATRHNCPIEKAALALLKIYQLIDEGYGGYITDEEWDNELMTKYTIEELDNELLFRWTYTGREHIAFHTSQQRDEFLSHPENVQLVKDFFML